MDVSTYTSLAFRVLREDVAAVSEILKDAPHVRGVAATLAFGSSNSEMISILLDYLIDRETPYYVVWNVFSYFPKTPHNGELDYTKTLVLDVLKTKGVDFNVLNGGGNTILFDYVHDTRMSELIISYGVDPAYRNPTGKTAYEYAISIIETEIDIQLEVVRLRREGIEHSQIYEMLLITLELVYVYEDPIMFYKIQLKDYIECLNTIRPTMTKRALSVRDKTC